MSDKRSQEVRDICDGNYNLGFGCRECPLTSECAPKVGDTQAVWTKRMNQAAEQLKQRVSG